MIPASHSARTVDALTDVALECLPKMSSRHTAGRPCTVSRDRRWGKTWAWVV